jgi:hypothetical protein
MYMGSLDYAGFNMVSHYAPLGEVGPCHDTWSAAYQMNEFKDGSAPAHAERLRRRHRDPAGGSPAGAPARRGAGLLRRRGGRPLGQGIAHQPGARLRAGPAPARQGCGPAGGADRPGLQGIAHRHRPR